MIVLIFEKYKNLNLKFATEDPNIIRNWLGDALKDLKRANHLYKKNKKDPEGYIYHLEQALEKAIKSYGMHLGLFEEKELRRIKHEFSSVYNRIVAPIAPINSEIYSNPQKFEFMLEILKNPYKNLDTPQILEIDAFIPTIITLYKLCRKILRLYSQKFEETIKNFIMSITAFAFPLLYFSVLFSYLYNLRYPDTKEKQLNYLEMNITKHLEDITSILEEFITSSKNLIFANGLEYYPLRSSVERHLKPIKSARSKEEKLKIINSSLEELKADKRTQAILDNIKSHPDFNKLLN